MKTAKELAKLYLELDGGLCDISNNCGYRLLSNTIDTNLVDFRKSATSMIGMLYIVEIGTEDEEPKQ